jgi:hypothetical protein
VSCGEAHLLKLYAEQPSKAPFIEKRSSTRVRCFAVKPSA